MDNQNQIILTAIAATIAGVVIAFLLQFIAKRLIFKKQGSDEPILVVKPRKDSDLLREKIEHAAAIRNAIGDKSNHKFKPLEAAIRMSMNLLGDLVEAISIAYPNAELMAEKHLEIAMRFRDLSNNLALASPDEEKEVPLTCPFIGYDSLLNLMNTKLLSPVASLRQKEASYEEVKHAAVKGLLAIADTLEKDAKLLVESANSE